MTPSSQVQSLATMSDLLPLSATTMTSDPQSVYSELRARWGQVAPVELEPGIPAWLILGHPEICSVVRNERLFARNPEYWRLYAEGFVDSDSKIAPMMLPQDTAYFADGDKHRRLREPLADGIDELNEAKMSTMVRQTCRDLVASFADSGSADLVKDYAAVVPMLAVGQMFGFGVDESERLRHGLVALMGSEEDAPAGSELVQEMLASFIAERREKRRNDLTTSFIEHPNLHNDYEVQHSMLSMFVAGFEVTKSWIAQTLRLMLTDGRFGGRLRGGRLNLDDALEEVLWSDPPISNLPARYALTDCELAGRRIERGDALVLGFAPANADGRMHSSDPWLEVGNRSHLAFGTGPHNCPAQRIARIITRTAVDTVFRLLHDVTMAVPAEELVLTQSPWLRYPAGLPVRFTGPDTIPY